MNGSGAPPWCDTLGAHLPSDSQHPLPSCCACPRRSAPPRRARCSPPPPPSQTPPPTARSCAPVSRRSRRCSSRSSHLSRCRRTEIFHGCCWRAPCGGAGALSPAKGSLPTAPLLAALATLPLSDPPRQRAALPAGHMAGRALYYPSASPAHPLLPSLFGPRATSPPCMYPPGASCVACRGQAVGLPARRQHRPCLLLQRQPVWDRFATCGFALQPHLLSKLFFPQFWLHLGPLLCEATLAAKSRHHLSESSTPSGYTSLI